MISVPGTKIALADKLISLHHKKNLKTLRYLSFFHHKALVMLNCNSSGNYYGCSKNAKKKEEVGLFITKDWMVKWPSSLTWRYSLRLQWIESSIFTKQETTSIHPFHLHPNTFLLKSFLTYKPFLSLSLIQATDAIQHSEDLLTWRSTSNIVRTQSLYQRQNTENH